MRRVLTAVLATFFLSVSLFAAPPQIQNFQDQLNAIEDLALRQTLEKSIAAGIIEDSADFIQAVANAEKIANNGTGIYYSAYNSNRNINEMRRLILEKCAPLTGLDRDAVAVKKNNDYKRAQLFIDIEGKIPGIYNKTIELCNKFNPKNGTNDHARLDDDIDAYLESIKNDPCIAHALKVTGTDINDLKKNWFGSGRGFEHVVAGEIDGKKISGYHWWYRFYTDERIGHAQVKTSIGGSDPKIYTGSFYWDPDGEEGPLPRAMKPKGGFLNGHSAQAMLALGHIAVEVSRQFGAVPGSLQFNGSINGEEYRWQLYTMGGNIRSLYPIGNKKGGDINPPGEEEIYYNQKPKK